MKTNLNKLVDDLRNPAYRPLLGKCPRVLVELADGDVQVCMGEYADYVNIDEATQLLGKLCNTLLLIKQETKLLTAGTKKAKVKGKTDNFSQGV